MRTIMLSAVAAIAMSTSAHAATFSASQTYNPVAIVDASSTTRSLTVSQFGTITDIDVIVDLTGSGSSINSIGNSTGGGFAFFNELGLRLTSPLGTVVNLINPNTYNSGDSLRFTLTLDDNAPSTLGGAPSSGSFQPVGSLASFNGEEANGTWIFTIQDTVGADPKSLNAATLNITTAPSVVPVPPAMALMVTGLGFFGWMSRRRKT